MWGSGSQLKDEIKAHWGPNQPDNKQEEIDGYITGAHCVSLDLYKLENSKRAELLDIQCSKMRHSVCEKLSGESLLSIFINEGSSARGQGEDLEVRLIAENDLLFS